MDNKVYKFHANRKISFCIAVIAIMYLLQLIISILSSGFYLPSHGVNIVIIILFFGLGIHSFYVKAKVGKRISIVALYPFASLKRADLHKIYVKKNRIVFSSARKRIFSSVKINASLLELNSDKAREMLGSLIEGNDVEIDENVEAFISGESDYLCFPDYTKVRGSLLDVITLFLLMLLTHIGAILQFILISFYVWKPVIVVPTALAVINSVFIIITLILIFTRQKLAKTYIKITSVLFAASSAILLALTQIMIFDILNSSENIFFILASLISIIAIAIILFEYLKTSRRANATLVKDIKRIKFINNLINNKNKARKKLTISILSVALIAIITCAVLLGVSNSKINSLMDDGKHYEAFKELYSRPLEKMCVSYDASQMKYYYAMASHESMESVKGQWELPDMTGWSAAEVSLALRNIGQEYNIVFEDDPEAGVNHVIAQSPKAGESVSPDEKVTLVVNSYYGNSQKYSFFPIYHPTAVESGEWVYYLVDNIVYKSRIDFKNPVEVYSSDALSYFYTELLGSKGDLFILSEMGLLGGKESNVIKYSHSEDEVVEEMTFPKFLLADLNGSNILLYQLNDNGIKEYDVTTVDINTYEASYSEVSDRFIVTTYGDTSIGISYNEGSKIFSKKDEAEEEVIFEFDKIINFAEVIDDKIYFFLEDYRSAFENYIAVLEYDIQTESFKTIFETEGDVWVQAFEKWQDEIIFLFSEGVYPQRGHFYSYNSTRKVLDKTFIFASSAHRYMHPMKLGNYIVDFSIDSQISRFNCLTSEVEYLSESIYD